MVHEPVQSVSTAHMLKKNAQNENNIGNMDNQHANNITKLKLQETQFVTTN